MIVFSLPGRQRKVSALVSVRLRLNNILNIVLILSKENVRVSLRPSVYPVECEAYSSGAAN